MQAAKIVIQQDAAQSGAIRQFFDCMGHRVGAYAVFEAPQLWRLEMLAFFGWLS